jgi:mono/diheme cytochrome c family protein
VRSPRAIIALAALAVLGAAVAACGQSIQVARTDPPQVKRGAVLFAERCSGCHTLYAAGAQGSKPERSRTQSGERTNGPNFNQRTEAPDNVMFAIRNGGFSGAIMPANVVVGQDAQAVAAFVAKYAGKHKG